MRLILLIISVVVLGWAVWIVSSNQSQRNLKTDLEACDKTFSTSNSASSSGNLSCSSSSFKSAKNIDYYAFIAIILGSLFTLGLVVSLKGDFL